MGVSLERVQFKFASIIGELCSEPDVLSQFAVWLDLRLAEYKLKGNISLDCSGEEPSPGWLNGLKLCRICGACNRADKQTEDHNPYLLKHFECAWQTDSTPNTTSVVTSPMASDFVKVESYVVNVDSDMSEEETDLRSQEVYLPNRKSKKICSKPTSESELYCKSPSALSNQIEHHLPSISPNQNLLLPKEDNGHRQTKGDVCDAIDQIAGSESDDCTDLHYLHNNSSTSLLGSDQHKTHRYTRTYDYSETSQSKLSNAEKQKLYRAKMKETMTEEQKERAKTLAKQRYLRWKSKHPRRSVGLHNWKNLSFSGV